jgi:hypothetical protein
MVRRMKLEIAYHGRPFHGWQRQRGQKTVQGELEHALATLFKGHEVSVIGAGRTDSAPAGPIQVSTPLVRLPTSILPDRSQPTRWSAASTANSPPR